MVVNGQTLEAREESYVKWIARWTVPYLHPEVKDKVPPSTRENMCIELAAEGTWWSLREGVLATQSNAWAYGNPGYNDLDGTHDPLSVVNNPKWAWQVGIAAGQVHIYTLKQLVETALKLYQPIKQSITIREILGKTAIQAGFSEGNNNNYYYNNIVDSYGKDELLCRAWLLRNHLVGFSVVPPQEVGLECLNEQANDITDCYGKNKQNDNEKRFAGNRQAMLNSISDLRSIYRSLYHPL